MKKEIYIAYSTNLGNIKNFLKFNSINTHEIELWSKNKLFYDLSLLPTNCLLILDSNQLIDLVHNCEASKINLQQFLSDPTNQILCCPNFDGSIILQTHYQQTFIEIDKLLSYPSQLILVVDAKHLEPVSVRNITVLEIPLNNFISFPRKALGNITKNQNCKDFLLTMGRKCLHRDLLWKELTSQNLLPKGNCVYHQTTADEPRTSWIGEKPITHEWYAGHPSASLYNNSWLEIIPETCSDSLYFFTEKTAKAIGTKTPFLVVSTPGYLQYLKSLGFKTFEKLIDESYDSEPDLELRILKIVDQLKNIIKTGSQNFFNNSKDICEHNYKHLAMLSSIKQDVTDVFYHQLLKNCDAL